MKPEPLKGKRIEKRLLDVEKNKWKTEGFLFEAEDIKSACEFYLNKLNSIRERILEEQQSIRGEMFRKKNPEPELVNKLEFLTGELCMIRTAKAQLKLAFFDVFKKEKGRD